MRAITVIRDEAEVVVELNWTWLPTFIGMNTNLKKEIEVQVAPCIEGQPLTNETLDKAHDLIVDFIVKKFPFPGLRDYLDALSFVAEGPLSAVPE